MDRHELGRRLRALRAARGSTVAAVATEAGLSVPYVANLENGRGNPTLDAVSRIARALGTRATIEFAAETDPEVEGAAVPLPAPLVRLGRNARFRRDVALLAEQRGADPTALAGRVLEALAGLATLTGRVVGEGDWFRLLDALVLVTLHPLDRPKTEGSPHA
jgi:transcriptional regulator with XRE-family HTH domain